MTRHVLTLIAGLLGPALLSSCSDGTSKTSEVTQKGKTSDAGGSKSATAASSKTASSGATKNGGSNGETTPKTSKTTNELPNVLHGFALVGDEPGSCKQLIERGTSLQKQGKFRDSISTLAMAARTKSTSAQRAEAIMELAETHFRQGKAGQEEKLEENEQVEPRDALQIAADLFDYVVAKYPKETEFSSTSSYMAGSSYLLLGDQKSALDRYDETFHKFGHTKQRPKALLRRGVCHAGLGDKATALRLYRQYVSEYRNDPDLKSAVRKVNKYIYELGVVGAPAPELAADEWVSGVMPNGLKDLRGEVVVLVFFMTGCGHCKSEMPKIRRDIVDYTAKGVVYVGTSDPDHQDAEAPVDSYIAQFDVKFFDVAIDRGGKNERPFRVRGYPAACIIDRKGIVRWRGHYAFLPHNLISSLLLD